MCWLHATPLSKVQRLQLHLYLFDRIVIAKFFNPTGFVHKFDLTSSITIFTSSKHAQRNKWLAHPLVFAISTLIHLKLQHDHVEKLIMVPSFLVQYLFCTINEIGCQRERQSNGSKGKRKY